MAGQQRKCANCRFFEDAGMPGNGWCTHPKRQLNSGVKLLVRAGELACRNTWGGDLFQSRHDTTEGPIAADLPHSDQDDEVTSVTIPSNKPAPAEDRVVRDRPAARKSQPLDSNDAAHRDQEERARLMARGNRDALAHARQRYSNRRHAPKQDDVVADDDVIESNDARVVSRQQRFSDRDFAASMPPLPTAPVPAEEVRRRGVAPEDRFDTVPEIDPDFDMPGQRHRAEPDDIAPPDPDPEPPTGLDQDQITAYEHVLQRARRIRESKHDRAKPIRRAHAFLQSDAVAPDPTEPWHNHHDDHPTATWRDEGGDPAPREPEPIQDDLGWIDFEDSRDAWADDDEDRTPADDDAAWDHASVVAAPYADTTASYVETATSYLADTTASYVETATSYLDTAESWDEDDVEWNEDGGYVDEPAPRRAGWLNRFRFGRRTAEPLHDDATITRHAGRDDEWPDDASDTWLEDDSDAWLDGAPREPDDESFLDRTLSDHRGAERRHRDRDLWAGQHHNGPDAHHPEPAPAWPDDYDDLPPWRGGTADPHVEELPAPAPVPAPVPAAERTGEAWKVAGMPVRPAPRPRQHLSAELPDLEDALFDDDFAFSAERPYDARSEADTSHQQGADSARDSFFRSSRYPRPDSSPTRHDDTHPEILHPESHLPDIEDGRLDVRDVVARGAELIDRRIEVAPEIPRACRTCRSFRSADGGTRGWCTNEWAFTHRRMVNEDDLACVSAIGCWWMPADHLRLDLDEDVGEVRTPRMDELIARNRPAARKVSGE